MFLYYCTLSIVLILFTYILKSFASLSIQINLSFVNIWIANVKMSLRDISIYFIWKEYNHFVIAKCLFEFVVDLLLFLNCLEMIFFYLFIFLFHNWIQRISLRFWDIFISISKRNFLFFIDFLCYLNFFAQCFFNFEKNWILIILYFINW